MAEKPILEIRDCYSQKTCPECRSQITRKMRRCPECGLDLTVTALLERLGGAVSYQSRAAEWQQAILVEKQRRAAANKAWLTAAVGVFMLIALPSALLALFSPGSEHIMADIGHMLLWELISILAAVILIGAIVGSKESSCQGCSVLLLLGGLICAFAGYLKQTLIVVVCIIIYIIICCSIYRDQWNAEPPESGE